MAPASTATREVPAAPNDHAHASTPRSTHGTTHNTGRPIPARPSRTASDDEILGLDSAAADTNGSVGARHAVPGEHPWRDAAHPSRPRVDARTAANTATAANSSTLSSRQRADVWPDEGPAVSGGDDPWREDASTSSPSSPQDRQHDTDLAQTAEPEALRATLDANPELRRAWDDAQAYRETFATPEAARSATALLADLDRMDALFFSRRPEDHAELARTVASLDPAAFASLAQAMSGLATESQRHGENRAGNRRVLSAPPNSPVIPRSEATRNLSSGAAREIPRSARDDSPQIGDSVSSAAETARTSPQPSGPTPAQTEFFHAANAAAVEGVLDAIQSQVERLLPEGVSKSARNRVVGEIYRELDTTLRSNRQLGQQMRDAFRSGALDAEHQRALVSLVTGRARQALPGVAKRVLNEWTSTVVAANQDRRTRQRAAEHRVDIAGSGGTGSDGPRSMTPREIDYKRMSDADILNL